MRWLILGALLGLLLAFPSLPAIVAGFAAAALAQPPLVAFVFGLAAGLGIKRWAR